MRVLYVHAGNMYGGTERVLETIVRLRRLCPSLEPHIALCFEGRLSDALRDNGTPPLMLGAVRILRPDLILRAQRRLRQILKRVRPDVVIMQSAWSHALFARVVRQEHLPLIWWVHDILTGRPPLERLAARVTPDFLICNSRITRDAARHMFPHVPAEVLRCPLAFARPTRSREIVRRSLATEEDVHVIVNVARMQSSKGHTTLLNALSGMRDQRWVCWLVGGAQGSAEERYERSLRQMTATLGLTERVKFVGHQTDVVSLLGAADIFCHPNLAEESFGLSVVEALYAGLPVVASELGGPREILTQACGRLVPPTAAALSQALSSLLDDTATRQGMSQCGPARALELCDAGPRLRDLDVLLQRVAIAA